MTSSTFILHLGSCTILLFHRFSIVGSRFLAALHIKILIFYSCLIDHITSIVHWCFWGSLIPQNGLSSQLSDTTINRVLTFLIISWILTSSTFILHLRSCTIPLFHRFSIVGSRFLAALHIKILIFYSCLIDHITSIVHWCFWSSLIPQNGLSSQLSDTTINRVLTFLIIVPQNLIWLWVVWGLDLQDFLNMFTTKVLTNQYFFPLLIVII